ncbi:hypothetical protein T484DRAFT_1829624 [Baffinella frigidus]|nr:hypothetical protein T484DRAFT_1829624 [Cryptophyta sp. CCMP2293]
MARGHTAAGGEEHGWRAFEVVIEQPNSRRAAGTSARFGRRGRLGRGGVALALAFACACATVWVVSDDGGGSSVEARVERAIDEQLGAAGLGYAHARGWSRAQALFLRDNSVGARSDFASRGDGGEAGAASEWARVEARQGAAGAHGGGAEGEWARFQDHHAAASSQLPQRGDTGAGSSAWGWVQQSRTDYWKNMDSMAASGVSSLRWPDEGGDGKLLWPSADGSSVTPHAPHLTKAGALLERGDIMPKTQPYLAWVSLCPLDTPKKERAYAWKYCVHHFVTNAEKRYCFQAVLAPPKPPPSCPPPSALLHARIFIPTASEEGFTPGWVREGREYTIECEEGYAMVGNAAPKCLEGGGYEEAGGCGAESCGAYAPVPHGSVNPSGDIPEGGAARISCDPGYHIIG